MIDKRISISRGRVEWFKSGKHHRLNGPAILIITPKDTYMEWYKNGKPYNRASGVIKTFPGGYIQHFYTSKGKRKDLVFYRRKTSYHWLSNKGTCPQPEMIDSESITYVKDGKVIVVSIVDNI